MSHILIIDDSPPIAQLMREMASLIGHTADTAYGGHDGLEKMRQTMPDLVLLDLMMPDMNGWQVHEEIRKFSMVPVIFITASDTPANRTRAAAMGEMLLSKEVTLTSLRQCIEQAIHATPS